MLSCTTTLSSFLCAPAAQTSCSPTAAALLGPTSSSFAVGVVKFDLIKTRVFTPLDVAGNVISMYIFASMFVGVVGMFGPFV